MGGTIVCGVTDSEAGRGALAVAAEVSKRLGLRLVLVHVADGIGPLDVNGEVSESVSTRANGKGASQLIARLAAEHGVAGRAEQRSAVGDAAALLGQIAADEAADVIVVGSRARGRLRRGLESGLVRQLETTTPVPVVIAPPWTRRTSKAAS
jgi:nucleotide-binding universal stress UspA family protein